MPAPNIHDNMPLTSLDDVVAALDQRQVDDGHSSWVVDVLGIHVAESHVWIQIARKHRPHESLIVRIAPGTTAGDVLRALTRERPRPDSQRILSISSAESCRPSRSATQAIHRQTHATRLGAVVEITLPTRDSIDVGGRGLGRARRRQ